MAIILVTDKASDNDRKMLERKGQEIGYTCPWSFELCEMVIGSITYGQSLSGEAKKDAASREANAYHIFEGLGPKEQAKIEQIAIDNGLDLAKLTVAETKELLGLD